MPVCARHRQQGFHAFACRDVCVAVSTQGEALDVIWWECVLEGRTVLASLLCSQCISQYQLPTSPASLDDPNFPENVRHNLLAIPICMRCFEEWRTTRGVVVAGIPTSHKSKFVSTNPSSK